MGRRLCSGLTTLLTFILNNHTNNMPWVHDAPFYNISSSIHFSKSSNLLLERIRKVHRITS